VLYTFLTVTKGKIAVIYVFQLEGSESPPQKEGSESSYNGSEKHNVCMVKGNLFHGTVQLFYSGFME
jgi:hypothetical protein